VITKVCGITRAADARHAVEHGATAIGFVFWEASPRFIRPEQAAEIVAQLPGAVTKVGVFVNQPLNEIRNAARIAGVTTIQLHGDESPEDAARLEWPVWRAISLARVNDTLHAWPSGTTVLLDAHDPVKRGGTGRAIDWRAAAEVAARRPVVLAGGLTPENVEEAIGIVHPVGVDVSSGVEATPGVKDFEKMARFLERARAGFNGHH
jgi:phosphoribosylanthranilate isomerase